MKNYNTSKYGGFYFLIISAYQLGNFSYKICDITEGNKITSFNIPAQLS